MDTPCTLVELDSILLQRHLGLALDEEGARTLAAWDSTPSLRARKAFAAAPYTRGACEERALLREAWLRGEEASQIRSLLRSRTCDDDLVEVLLSAASWVGALNAAGLRGFDSAERFAERLWADRDRFGLVDELTFGTLTSSV